MPHSTRSLHLGDGKYSDMQKIPPPLESEDLHACLISLHNGFDAFV